MSLHFEILGQPGRDNALWVTIDAGQSTSRLLFDCGEGCLGTRTKSFGDITTVDELFFSHLHMDHVGGFDSFFRCNFSRSTRPNRIWGPPDTARILQHRFRGFLWNLYEDLEGTWLVSDIGLQTIRTTRFELREGFEIAHSAGEVSFTTTILEHEGYSVETMALDHRTPSMAYLVREPARWNIDQARLAASGLRPGPWMQRLKGEAAPGMTVEVGGTNYPLDALRRDLLRRTPGESVAYLSDFRLDVETLPAVASWLSGCGTLVCEGQYRHADAELAMRHRHMTTRLTATLAREAGVGRLILIHLSERYTASQWLEMLSEAREVFPETAFPLHWTIDAGGAVS
jgi:ribonuclease Z